MFFQDCKLVTCVMGRQKMDYSKIAAQVASALNDDPNLRGIYRRRPSDFLHKTTPQDVGSVDKSRIFYLDGRITEYDDGRLALEVYYALEPGVGAAFRAAGDETPVYPHDYERLMP